MLARNDWAYNCREPVCYFGICSGSFLASQPILDHACLCLCALLEHTCLTEHTRKVGSLVQCPITVVFLHRSLPNLVAQFRRIKAGRFVITFTVKSNSCKFSSAENHVRFGLFCDILADCFYQIARNLIKKVYSKGSNSLIVLLWIKRWIQPRTLPAST